MEAQRERMLSKSDMALEAMNKHTPPCRKENRECIQHQGAQRRIRQKNKHGLAEAL